MGITSYHKNSNLRQMMFLFQNHVQFHLASEMGMFAEFIYLRWIEVGQWRLLWLHLKFIDIPMFLCTLNRGKHATFGRINPLTTR